MRPLSDLDIGQHVHIPDMKTNGEVQGACAPRSYVVQTPNGAVRRNRSHLRDMTVPDAALEPNGAESTETTTRETATPPREAPLRRSQRTIKPPDKLDL